MNDQSSFSPRDPIDRADKGIVWVLRIGLAAFVVTLIVLLALALGGAGWSTWATLATVGAVTLAMIGIVLAFVFLTS